ncbi:hypothetical protein CYY_005008 [Polysphondylium violaceum]|uniref:MACPF domain-containing protein n=1 Tax=Polysphondylium violaceum TaxID=133409 RepID=A0A8J4Q4A2_9MYCE|nr:hypothetical protein CYY_005008 [Polysphondylium violaceum]
MIVVTLGIKDQGTGLYEINCVSPNGIFRAVDVIISGSLFEGVFELVFDLSKNFLIKDKLSLELIDFNNNRKEISYFTFDLHEATHILNPKEITIADFSYFKFNHESIDTTFGHRKTSLFFRVSDLPIDFTPQIYINESSVEFVEPKRHAYSFIGKYHRGMEMFVIDIELPSKLFDTNLSYILFAPTKIERSALETKFGSDATIKITSKYFDNYPPMITNFKFIKSHVVEIDVDQEIEIGWEFEITDNPNGFCYGTFEITSDKDGSPFVFNISSIDRISGNEFQGYYPITFKVYGNTIDQSYSISSVNLYDKNGRVSTYPTWDYPTRLSPLLRLSKDHSIKLVCKNVVSLNTLAPSLKPVQGFSYSFNPVDRMVSFTIKVVDNGGRGFSPFSKHNPIVYVDGIYDHIKVQTNVCGSCANTASLITYIAKVELNYNLIISGCSFSVFGIVDRHMNFYGANAKSLKELGFKSTLKKTDIYFIPSISSITPISDIGGDITIHGERFTSKCKVYTQNNGGEFTERTVKILSSTMIITTIPSSKTDINVKVLYSPSKYTNTIKVSPFISSKKKFVYIDTNSNCATNCGTIDNPYKTIKEALTKSDSFSDTLLILPGVYVGEENTQIDITVFREIFSLSGPETTIINCEGYGYGIKAKNAKRLILTGVTLRNCVSDQGGALSLYNTPTRLVNVHFVNNTALNGGAVYVFGQELSIKDSVFYNNTVVSNGASIYADLAIVKIKGDLTSFVPNIDLSSNTDSSGRAKDILCRNSTIKIDETIDMNKADFECFDGCDSSYANKPLCLSTIVNYKAGKSVCTKESCLSRPDECSCLFSGLVLETYSQDCSVLEIDQCESYHQQPAHDIVLEKHSGGQNKIVNRFYGYLSVSESKYVTLLFTGSNYGYILKINTKEQFSMIQNTRFNQTKTIYLTHKHVHFIEIIVFSSVSQSSQRYFQMTPFLSINDDIFYSNLICGDKVLDKMESFANDDDDRISNPFYCPADLEYPTLGSNPYCGDKICNEVPDECFQDCFDVLTKTCPTRTVPDGHIAPGFFVSDDTLGELIYNQFIWKLPGSDHLTFGIDIVNGEEASAPIFQFDYCQHIAPNIMEDIYRGNVYLLPDQFNARPLPECTYSSSTKSNDTSFEVSQSLQASASQSYEASVSGGFMGTSGSVTAAYSQEKSSKEASKLSTNSKEKIFKTDLYCKTSFVEMDMEKIALHPNLLRSLSEVVDVEGVVELVKKHGTHFYNSAFLGGKLTQLTIVKSSDVKKSSESSFSQSAAASLSASVNSPSFSVSASVSGSLDSSNDKSQEESNRDSSTTSRILTYGGAPAAFSPAQDGESSPTYSDWSRTIDLLPVPIDYRLVPIRNLIKDTWKSKHNPDTNLKSLWEQAEDIYYAMNQFDFSSSQSGYSLIFELDSSRANYETNNSPELEIIYWVKGKDKPLVFRQKMELVHVGLDGREYGYLYKNSKLYSHARCFRYTAFNRDISTSYATDFMSCDYGAQANMQYPIRLDFTGPNFFSSVKTPEIKLTFKEGDESLINYNNPAKIISWLNNQAILFNQDGVITKGTDYYLSTAFENRWAWHTSKSYLFRNYYPGSHTVSCTDDFSYTSSGTCKDSIIFKFGKSIMAGNKEIPDNNNPVQGEWFATLGEERPLINWFNYKAPIGNDFKGTLEIAHRSDIGLQSRIYWVKVFYPSNDNNWLFDIKAYHIKSDQNSIHSKEYLEVNIEPGTPKDRFSPYKFITLKPLEISEPKQLFFYHNYNYPVDGVLSTGFESIYNLPSYAFILLDGKNITFLDSGTGNSYHY